MITDGAATYTYDAANRLTQWNAGSDTATFAYNGFGDRVEQTFNGQTTQYQLDLTAGLTQVVGEFAPGDETWYLLGLDLIAQDSSAAGWSYPLTDGLGSVRAVMGSGNSVLHATNYDPYGNPLDVGGLTQSAFGFTGQQTDDTGLQYLRARYYSPALGTFLTTDPVLGVTGGPVSTFNPYSYVRGNTVNWIDPSGMITGLEVLALTAFVAAASSIITGISSLIGEIAGQLRNNGGDWNCLDIGEAARAARDAALRGGAVGAGVGAIGGGLAFAAPWLIPAAGGLASQSPDRVQDAVEVVGEAVEVVGDIGESVGDAITHALTNGDPSPIQGALPSAVSNTANIIPRLTPGDGGTMYRQAVGFLKELPQDLTIRAEWFDDFAKQITDLSTTEWNSSFVESTDGSYIHSGKLGHSLIISPNGELYRGNLYYSINGFSPLGQNVPQFIREGAQYTPIYENLRKIE